MRSLETQNIHLFNNPLEAGLRSIILLNKISRRSCDLQRLQIYDYLMVHSSDAGGPPSLHPATPHRSGELIIRRQLLLDGLALMYSKELVDVVFEKEGISYKATELTELFLAHFETVYALKLQSLAEWVIHTFDHWSDEKLHSYINDYIDKWGGEFINESLIRGELF